MNRAKAGEQGSIAIEFLVCGLVVPCIITGAVIQLTSEQRFHFAAQQLAREYARSLAAGLPDTVSQSMEEAVANSLGIEPDAVRVTATKLDPGIIEAAATVAGSTELARMREQP